MRSDTCNSWSRRPRSGLLLCGAVLAAAMALLPSCWSKKSLDPDAPFRHIFLVTLDTLRADYVGAYGSEKGLTPHLDRIAEEGACFTRCYSHIPMTGPAHASMLTGQFPSGIGVLNNTHVLSGRYTTLPEAARDAGYETAAFVSLGTVNGKYGFKQGFSHYDDVADERLWWRRADEVNARLFPWLDENRGKPFFVWVHYSDPHSPNLLPPEETDRIEVFLDEEPIYTATFHETGGTFRVPPFSLEPGEHRLRIHSGNGPKEIAGDSRSLSFLKIAPLAPSGHCTVEYGDNFSQPTARGMWEPGRNMTQDGIILIKNHQDLAVTTGFEFVANECLTLEEMRRRYEFDVAHMDQGMGALMEKVGALGLQKTLFVITSDHGQGLGDHNLRGHENQLYDTLVRACFVIHAPGVILPARIDLPVAHVDLYPTVLDLMGVRPSAGEPVMGRNLKPLLSGGKVGERAIYLETYKPESTHDRKGLQLGPWKYIHTEDDGAEELYQSFEDPGELRNLAEGEPERLDRMKEYLQEILKLRKNPLPEESELDEETRARLRALGYLK